MSLRKILAITPSDNTHPATELSSFPRSFVGENVEAGNPGRSGGKGNREFPECLQAFVPTPENSTAGNAIAELSPASSANGVHRKFSMDNAISLTGVVDRSARTAHAIVREQIAALLAPLYLISRCRRNVASMREAAKQAPVDRVGVHASVPTRS